MAARSRFAGLVVPEPLGPDALPAYRRRMARLEELGYESLVMPDTQSIWRELYVSLTVLALSTERVRLWPAVSNPLTRHPAVTASAIASLDELSGGRALLNLGSGDSAVYSLGLRGARLATLREYVTAVRELFAGGETLYRARRVRLTWPTRRIPVYVTAEGPRTLELAGEIADGVVVGTGLQREVVEDALAAIARGAARAGRRREDLEIWWFVKWNLDDDKAAAVREMRMTLTASANHAFRFTLEGKHVPEQYRDPIRRLQAAYVFEEHERPGAERRNARLVEEAGLTDYLAERFTLAGGSGEFRQKLEGLRALGVENFLMAFFGETQAQAKHERLAAEVMARL